MIAAGRKLAGLDLDGLARAAEVSPSTISNVEGGKKRARPENLAAIQRALLMNGVTLMNDNLNGRILLSITYKLPDPIDIFAIAKDE
jgi:transcriptional regulator with XRE-family HTH domain